MTLPGSTLIAQISDLHLRDDGADPCHDPAAAMRAAFAQIAALDLRPDAILLTGDIIDRSAQSYDHAVSLLRESPVPLLPMPGNHDRAEEFRAAFRGWADYHPGHLSFIAAVGDLLLVALDSNLPGGRGGLDQARIDWLAGVLARAAAPVILALHHPPFPTLVPHLERGGFKGAGALARLIRGSAVCRVIAGHSHRSIHSLWAGVGASTAPAIRHGLELRLTGEERPLPVCVAPQYELHHLRDGAVVSHQMTCA